MTKYERRYSLFASFSGLCAIVIAVLFFVQKLSSISIISALDIYMAVNYVTYFVGLALIFTGMYCREKEYRKTKIFSFTLGTLFIMLAIALLVYGYVSGNISF